MSRVEPLSHRAISEKVRQTFFAPRFGEQVAHVKLVSGGEQYFFLSSISLAARFFPKSDRGHMPSIFINNIVWHYTKYPQGHVCGYFVYIGTMMLSFIFAYVLPLPARRRCAPTPPFSNRNRC